MINKPKLITQRDLIRDVANKWKEAYWDEKNGTYYYGSEKGEIHQKLLKLDLEKCSAESVNKIIGNKSWTELKCDQCQKRVRSVVMVGQKPDYESSTTQLCRGCIQEAGELFFKGEPK